MSLLAFDRKARLLCTSLMIALAIMMSSSAHAQDEQEAPKVEIFGGYSWLHPGGTLSTGKIPDISHGWAASATYDFTPHFGLTLDGGGHYSDFSNIGTLMFGPTFNVRTSDGVNMFVHGMAGLHRLSPAGLPTDNNIGTMLGGGMDLPVGKRLAIRLFEANYEWAHHNFSGEVPANSPSQVARPNLRGADLRTGLVLKLGSQGPPPAPLAASCAAQPTEVLPGEPVTVTATASNVRKDHTVAYNWTSSGGKIQGKENTAQVDTNGLAPGSYTATARVNDPKLKKNGDATCTANFTVKELPKHPPTISCSASPTTLQTGAPATITCETNSPDNSPVTVEYSTSAGKITGSGNTATLDTTGAAPGPITVTAKATDARGLTGETTTSVTVENPPPPPPQSSKLNEIEFPNKAKPWRVDNTAKAVLDDVALRLQREPDAKAVIVGQQDPTERRKNLAAERAVDTKAYLTQEKGIDASRIEVRTGTAGGQKAEIFIVPAGATFNQADTQPVDETRIKPIPDHPAKKARKKATQ